MLPEPLVTPDSSRPSRILVLEDDPLIRRAFRMLAVSRTDVIVETVETPDEVRERLHAQPPVDLIVCDFRLRPGSVTGTSAELVRELHRERRAVALLTGYPRAAIVSLGLRVPVYTKPVTLDELLEALPSRRPWR